MAVQAAVNAPNMANWYWQDLRRAGWVRNSRTDVASNAGYGCRTELLVTGTTAVNSTASSAASPPAIRYGARQPSHCPSTPPKARPSSTPQSRPADSTPTTCPAHCAGTRSTDIGISTCATTVAAPVNAPRTYSAVSDEVVPDRNRLAATTANSIEISGRRE